MKTSNFCNALGALILLITTLIACDKPTQIGGSFINNFDSLNVQTVDSYKVELVTAREDTLRTALRSAVLLGTMDDADFGKSSASLYLQPDLTTNNFIFPGGDVLGLDSVVLMLDYNSFYGDTLIPQTFTVHELSEAYSRNDTLNGYSNYNYHPSPIGQLSNYVMRPVSPTYVGSDTVVSHIRITLDYNFGLKILSQSGTYNLENADNFHNFFPGLIVKADETQGGRCVASISPTGSYTRLMVYYHSNTSDSLKYGFAFNGVNGVFHNTYYHDFNGNVNAMNLYDKCDTIFTTTSVVYVQSMQSTQALLRMPTLKNTTSRIINKGVIELYAIKNDPSQDSIYRLPKYLALDIVDSLCNEDNIIWGEAVAKTINGVDVLAYQFIITSYLQELMDTKKTPTFMVSTYSQVGFSNLINCYTVNPFQVKLFGSADPIFGPKLILTSTLIN